MRESIDSEIENQLATWYFKHYTEHKNYREKTAKRVAQGFACTVCYENCLEIHSSFVGNLRGILGEVLTRAALVHTGPSNFHPSFSPRSLDKIGIDICVTNGNPDIPVVGFGVKLGHGGRPNIIRKIPTINLHINAQQVGVDELIAQQQDGYFSSPERFMQERFSSSSELRQNFMAQVGRQCALALTDLDIRPFPYAHKYLNKFTKHA